MASTEETAPERETARGLILVAIPAHNEADSIADVVRAIPRDAVREHEVAVIVFDDGSADATSTRAREAGAEVIRSEQPGGLAAFFRAAAREALERDADILVNIDGDGQFDAGQIPEVARPVLDGTADFSAGDRFSARAGRPENMPWIKYAGNGWMTALIRRITGLDVRDVSCGFRAYGREALLRLNLQSRFTYTQETFLDLAVKGVRIVQVPVGVRYFEGRESRIARSLVRYVFNTLVTIFRAVRDYRPLRTFGIAALALLLPGLAAGAFVLVHYLTAGAFSPYIFLAMASAYLISLALVVAIVGLASDMLAPIRRNQEALIYLNRRQLYGRGRRRRGDPGRACNGD